MSYRDILVHVPSPVSWPPHLVQAAQVAREFDARLTGIQIVEAFPPLSVPEAPGMAAALQQQIEQEYVRASGNGDAFARHMASLGVDEVRWQAVEGDISRALTHAGAGQDLLVMGVAGDDFRASVETVAQTVIESAMPCFVVPEPAKERAFKLDVVAIAWNGALEAIRAVHSALPLLLRTSHVVVISGSMREYPVTLPHPPVFDLTEYLARHGIGARHVDLGAGEGNPGAALLEQVAEAKADVLVMGAYGRSRLREWIFGGATRKLLHESPVPLLLRH